MENMVLSVYKGEAPYIFVSYAHADTDRVLPMVKALQDAGYRIWFDQGIEAGTEWSNNIAEHLSGCSAFLFFTSANSVKSENCLDEVAYAKSHNKLALLVYLEEDVVLPSGTEMQTARFQRMYANRQNSIGAFVENFAAAAIFDPCRGEVAAVPVEDKPILPAPKPAKKPVSKGLLIGVVAAAVVALAVILLLVLTGESKRTAAGDETQVTTQNDAPTETQPQKVVELSDSLQDHTFRLNGVVYQLPVSYKTLTGNGWTLGPGTATEDSYMSGLSEVEIALVSNGKAISVYAYNDSENAKKLKDCMIGGVKAEAGSGADFCIASQMKAGATQDALTEAFGVPTDRYEGSDYVKLTWSLGEYAKAVAFCYDESSSWAKYSSLAIYNYVLPAETTKTNETAPKYLDSYVAPAALGSDLYAGIVSVDGALYELPVPVREFTKNGWTVSSGAATVASGGEADLTLSKDGHKINVTVVNLSLYKTLVQNCVVTELEVESRGGAQVLLPGDIALGMSINAMKTAVPADMELYDSDYSVSYSYYDSNERDFSLRLYAVKDDGMLTNITVSSKLDGLVEE